MAVSYILQKEIHDTTEEVIKNNEINETEIKEQDPPNNQENIASESKENPEDNKNPINSEDIKVEVADTSNTDNAATAQQVGDNIGDLDSPGSEEYDEYDEPDDYDSDAPPDKDIPPMKPFNPFMDVKPALTIGKYKITKRFINRILFPVYVGQKEGDNKTWYIIKEIEKSGKLTVEYVFINIIYYSLKNSNL